MKFEIWHNPRCSKSREALKILEEAGAEVTVRRYLEDPPSVTELRKVIQRIGIEPIELVRREEDAAEALGLDRGDHNIATVTVALAGNPILIQRPVVVAEDGRAVIGRPPDRVRELLGD